MNSQKLLALSDTHGDARSLKAVLEWAKRMLQDGAIGTAVSRKMALVIRPRRQPGRSFSV